MKRASCAGGFTLVELLVALGLMSLISLTLVGAYRGVAQISDRFDGWQQAADNQRLLVSGLSELFLLGYLPPGAAGTERVFFAGEDQLVWVGVMPPRHAHGGKHIFRLSVEPSDRGDPSSLVLRYVPWSGRSPDWTNSTRQPVLTGVQGLRLYYSADGAPWQQSDNLGFFQGPDRVTLSVQLANGAVSPSLVLPFPVLRRSSPASFGAGAGR